MTCAIVIAGTLLARVVPSAQPATFAPDAKGFIRNWVVLAPIPIVGDSGADELDSEFLKNEAALAPRDGEKVSARGWPLTWKAHQATDYFVDFLTAFGKDQGEYVGAYAVTYVIADAETRATLAVSSNDQGKGWFNGQQFFRFADARTLTDDSDTAEVVLKKGQNVLVMKVINEVNNWQACARFLKNGAPITNLKISVTPE